MSADYIMRNPVREFSWYIFNTMVTGVTLGYITELIVKNLFADNEIVQQLVAIYTGVRIGLILGLMALGVWVSTVALDYANTVTVPI